VKTRAVSHFVALPFTLKSNYLKAKEEELWKLKSISPCKKNYNLKKNKILNKKPKPFKIL
jgi:hypothetical protein